MNDTARLSRRDLLQAGGLFVCFSFAGVRAQVTPAAKPLAVTEVDSFIACRPDGRVIVYSGKVDLGTGHRIAMRQMVGEELSLAPERIDLVEGDTALTPNQGPTAGSTGVMRGGVELRRAAASLREGLLALGAQRLGRPATSLTLADGVVSGSDGARISVAQLVGERPTALKLNANAPLKSPTQFRFIGQSLPRPDIPEKVTGRQVYVHDFTLPAMWHARVVRPAAVGATLVSVDESSIGHIPDVKVVRLRDFLAVAAPDEWAAHRAARELKVQWSDHAALVGHRGVIDWARRGPFSAEETLLAKGDAAQVAALAQGGADVLRAQYEWPLQSHASMGPSCAVADVREGGATVWSASQATHRLVGACAAAIGLPREKVRIVYLDGAGCYGTNGHDDATVEAAMLSRALGRPVRVQWTREDELGWDPKGPPQLLALRGTLTPEGRIGAWETEMWLPRATANLEWIPLLSPLAAGLPQPQGQSTGLVTQNGDPPYTAQAVKVHVHWLGAAPLRPSNIRAPGKVANCFAVESFVDELAARAAVDPLQFRLRDVTQARGREVMERLGRLMQWQPRPSPHARAASRVASGRGMAYIHYKHSETFVAVGMDVEVDRGSGEVRVRHIACVHDCGLMINPDAVRAQVEGNLLQTLSRTLHEETQFDRARVTSVDFASYPLLRMTEVPRLSIELVQRLDQPPLGAGEAASSPVPAALGNAIFDATGVRLRSVPFRADRLRALLA